MDLNDPQQLTSLVLAGLDPADPFIEGSISKDDAAFVDIIHSDGGFYGREGVMGHVDFYPNNGVHPQKNCLTVIIILSPPST